MEILNTIIFYILVIVCIFSTVCCLFQKNTTNSIIAAIVLFWSFSGFYFLLNAPYLAAIQIMLWGVGIGILMLFSIMMTNLKNDKSGIAFDIKTLFAPVLAVIFALLIIPFILYQFKGFKTLQSYSLVDFALNLYKHNAFAFELTGVLLFAAIVGIVAIITLKNTHKFCIGPEIFQIKKEKNK